MLGAALAFNQSLLVFLLQIGDRSGELTAQLNMAQLRAALGLGPGEEHLAAAHPYPGYEAQGEFWRFGGIGKSGIRWCGEGPFLAPFASGQEMEMLELWSECLHHKGMFALCFPQAAKAGNSPQKKGTEGVNGINLHWE